MREKHKFKADGNQRKRHIHRQTDIKKEINKKRKNEERKIKKSEIQSVERLKLEGTTHPQTGKHIERKRKKKRKKEERKIKKNEIQSEDKKQKDLKKTRM